MDNERKGFFARFFAPIETRANLPFDEIEVREGSIDSAGGDSPLPGIVPPSRSEVSPLTVESALSMSAVYRAVDILCTSVQQLELRVERNGSALKTVPALIRKPDINSNLSKFLKKTTMSMATHGNAYWKVTRADANAPVTNLEVLDPNTVSIGYDKNGNRYFQVSGKDLKEWQVKHIKLMEPFGSDYGLGPIQAARGELRGHLDQRDYASQWFTKGAIPTGILSSKDYMDAEAAREYKTRWEANQATRGVAVLGNGLAYEPILLNPADAQFLENQAFSITQVARLFGIPANYLLADAGNSLTYQNMIQVDTAFIRYTVSGYTREIEEAFTDLLPRGQEARFNFEGFLRADDKTRAEVNKTYKEMGVLSAEEIRMMEGWGPLPVDLATTPNPNEGNDNA